MTGLLYIDLMDDRTGKHAAPAIAGLKYPVIRSSPSQFDVFLSSLPELVADAGEVVRRANQLFSDANLNAIAGALAGIETAARGLPQTSRDLSALVVELRGATAELAAAAKGAHHADRQHQPDIEAATQRLHVIADHLADASGQIDGLHARQSRRHPRLRARRAAGAAALPARGPGGRGGHPGAGQQPAGRSRAASVRAAASAAWRYRVEGRPILRAAALLVPLLLLGAGCSGLLHSTAKAEQTYFLRATATAGRRRRAAAGGTARGLPGRRSRPGHLAHRAGAA